MNNEDKIHINSFKFYDRDELEELTEQYYLENEQLLKENQELKEQLKIKHDGFMASVEETCELAKENQKYKEVITEAFIEIERIFATNEKPCCNFGDLQHIQDILELGLKKEKTKK